MVFPKVYSLIVLTALSSLLMTVPLAGAVKTFYIEGNEVESQSIPGRTLLFINITVVNGSYIDLYVIEEERYIRIMYEGGVIEDEAILIWKNVSSIHFQFYGENATRYYLVMVPVDRAAPPEQQSVVTDVAGSTVDVQIKYEDEEEESFYMGVGLTVLTISTVFYGALRRR